MTIKFVESSRSVQISPVVDKLIFLSSREKNAYTHKQSQYSYLIYLEDNINWRTTYTQRTTTTTTKSLTRKFGIDARWIWLKCVLLWCLVCPMICFNLCCVMLNCVFMYDTELSSVLSNCLYLVHIRFVYPSGPCLCSKCVWGTCVCVCVNLLNSAMDVMRPESNFVSSFAHNEEKKKTTSNMQRIVNFAFQLTS